MLELLGLWGIWGTVFGVIFMALMLFFSVLPKNEKSRARVIEYLREDTVANKYRAWLTRGLNQVDKWLSAPEIKLRTRKISPLRSWSVQLLNFVLTFALAYPLLSLFAQWVFTGEGTIETGGVLPREDDALPRLSFGLAILCFISLAVFAQLRLSARQRLALQLGASTLLFAIAIAFVFSDVFSAVTTDVFLVVAAFAVAGAFAIEVAGAFSVAVAFAFGVAGSFAGAFAVAFAIAVAGTVAGGSHKLSEKVRVPVFPLLCWTILAIVAISGLIKFTLDDGVPKAALVLFYSVLPLLNGLTDFMSVGATRYFLRRGLAGNLVINGFWDLCVGVATFFSVGILIIIYIHWVRPPNNVPLIALDILFDGLRDRPGDYWWLFAMMFSTLLPTAAHFILWLFAGFTLLGGGLRRRLARGIEMGGEGEVHPDWLARLFLCLCLAAAIWVPVFVLVEGARLAPGLVQGVIGIFEGFAQMIGAVPAGKTV